jgi:hypothetical protein
MMRNTLPPLASNDLLGGLFMVLDWPRIYGTSLRHFGPSPTFTTFVTNVTLESPTCPVTSQQPGVGKIR